MDWQDVLSALLPGVPAVLLVMIFLSVIKTHVQLYIDGKPGRYRVCLENLDDVASLDTVRLELRTRGSGRFLKTRPHPLGFGPWPVAYTAQIEDRTMVLTAAGLRRHERWLFEVDTDGDDQGLEAHCRIGRRELPVIASDGIVSEYTDNPGASKLNAWLGLGLSPLLYLGFVFAPRVFQGLHPLFEWVNAWIALGVLLASYFSLRVMRQPRQAVIAHPSTRPAFPAEQPRGAREEAPPEGSGAPPAEGPG